MMRWILCLSLVLSCSIAAAGERPFGPDDAPRIVRVGPAGPAVLAVHVHAQARLPRGQEPYASQPGDRVLENGGAVLLERDGQVIGALVGRDRSTIKPFDELVGKPMNLAAADEPASYQLIGPQDPSDHQQPVSVARKSKPRDVAEVAWWHWRFPSEHVIYLTFPHELSPGGAYELRFPGLGIEPVAFTYAPHAMHGEAVHITHVGFAPTDPVKLGFVSLWTGDGGPSPHVREGLGWQVVDDQTGQAHATGTTKLRLAAEDETGETRGRNYNRVNVYACDFSELTRPGTYRLVVDTLGSSLPFTIGTDVYREPAFIALRGLYHHRSGIELRPPYTTFNRPRPMHPDDTPVLQAGTTLYPLWEGQPDGQAAVFTRIVETLTDEHVPQAFGGYMDAGDWDRRVQHLSASRLLLELAELYPAFAAELNLNLPESDNDLPDVIDEAIFGLDVYRRLQRADGAVSGGIESTEHPVQGEASWQESLPIAVFAPDPLSSLQYAAVAAQAARVLNAHDDSRSLLFAESAVNATTWALAELQRRDADLRDAFRYEVRDAKNAAAVELYRLTGEAHWHELFLETTVFAGDRPEGLPWAWESHDQRDAAFSYVMTKRPTDAAVRQAALSAILREAGQRGAMTRTSGFAWASEPNAWVGWGRVTAPDTPSVARAYYLTGDDSHRATLVRQAQFVMGANPANLSMTTGIGHRYPQNPLHFDSRVTAQPAPPGITVYGPLDTREYGTKYWTLKRLDEAGAVHPPVPDWPTTEAYFDVFKFPASNEYTIHQTIAPVAYHLATLAAVAAVAEGEGEGEGQTVDDGD